MRDLVTLHRFYGATFSAVWPCYRSSNHCRGGERKKTHLPTPQCELNPVSHTSSDRLSVSCCPPVPLRYWHRSQFHCHAISTLAAPSRTSFHNLRCYLQHFELCWLVALQPGGWSESQESLPGFLHRGTSEEEVEAPLLMCVFEPLSGYE